MPNFVSFTASIAELALGEKLRTQSLSHSPSLFDALGTKVLVQKSTIALVIYILLLLNGLGSKMCYLHLIMHCAHLVTSL